MPLFEYRCEACAHLEEVLQKHTDPAPESCPACGKAGTMAKAISLTSFQLKGGGWYKDLYASSANKGDSSSSTPATTTTSSTTSAPSTSAPSTSAPSTSAPSTSAPSTSAAPASSGASSSTPSKASSTSTASA